MCFLVSPLRPHSGETTESHRYLSRSLRAPVFFELVYASALLGLVSARASASVLQRRLRGHLALQPWFGCYALANRFYPL